RAERLDPPDLAPIACRFQASGPAPYADIQATPLSRQRLPSGLLAPGQRFLSHPDERLPLRRVGQPPERTVGLLRIARRQRRDGRIQVPMLERARRRPCRTVHPGCERRIPRLRTLPCCQGELARKPPGIDQPGIEPLLRELAGKRRITLTQVREQARPGRFQRVGDGLHLSVDGDDVGVVAIGMRDPVRSRLDAIHRQAEPAFDPVDLGMVLAVHRVHGRRFFHGNDLRVVVEAEDFGFGEAALAQAAFGVGPRSPAVVAQLIPGLRAVASFNCIPYRMPLHCSDAPVVRDGDNGNAFHGERHACVLRGSLVLLDGGPVQLVRLVLGQYLVEPEGDGSPVFGTRTVHLAKKLKLTKRQINPGSRPDGDILVPIQCISPTDRCSAVTNVLDPGMHPLRIDQDLAKAPIVLFSRKMPEFHFKLRFNAPQLQSPRSFRDWSSIGFNSSSIAMMDMSVPPSLSVSSTFQARPSVALVIRTRKMSPFLPLRTSTTAVPSLSSIPSTTPSSI